MALAAVGPAFGTDLERGLTGVDAAERLQGAGPNALDEQQRLPAWRLLARQFANTLTAVLAVAAVVTVVVGDTTDAIAIAVIVVLNALVGFVQEHRAERAMAALQQMATTNSRVVREGELRDVPTPEVVPGDVVHLASGDIVPADLRLVAVHGLRVDEAALTGESDPTAKVEDPITATREPPLPDQLNMAFRGTAVTVGRAVGVAVATGMATELGRIATLLEDDNGGVTPLQRRLAQLGRRLAVAALVVCAVVFTSGVASGESAHDMFLIAVSLAVAAIPEGLPAVVTVALALGAHRMALHHAVVRRLPAVETLGSVTVVCTDKTGTLTENRMMVERVWTPHAAYAVSGSGYDPEGSLTGPGDPATDPLLGPLAEVAAACNDAVLHAPRPGDPDWTITGDPTEGALLTFAAKAGVDPTALRQRRPRIAEVAFDARRRHMSTAHRLDGRCWVAAKGALGALAPLLDPVDAGRVAEAERAAERLAGEGYRVLALAQRRLDDLPDQAAELEQGLRLLGLVALVDPPRAEAAAAIAVCRDAGITPVMITGDHPGTATTIARRLGLIDGTDARVVTGEELDALDDDALAERVTGLAVYARTDPEQKLRIVDAWQARGAVVAMTGDGVNDAPALRRADIGVAMGLVGTDVSREAADMVLTDDDFATIVAAVEEGRRIYDNIRRFVRYLLSSNSGEIWVMFLAPLLGLPVPLRPLQILWINLVTDGLPAVALGLEPAEPGTMRRPPRPPEESILARGLWQQALWVGLLMAVVILPIQAFGRAADWPWQTMVFTTLALMQLGNAVAARSEEENSLRLGRGRANPWMVWAVAVSAAAQMATVYVPALRSVFHTQPLDGLQLSVVLALSAVPFLAIEAHKRLRRARARA